MLLGRIMEPNLIERLSEHYSFSLLIKASNDLGLCVLVSPSSLSYSQYSHYWWIIKESFLSASFTGMARKN